MSNQTPWHLDKRLSVGTLLSLAVMGAGGITAFASLQAEVKNISDNKVGNEQVARIEERQKLLSRDVDEIKKKVEILPSIQSDIQSLLRDLEHERETRREERRAEREN